MNYKIDTTKWIDIEEILEAEPWVDKLILVTANGTGKSWSTIKWQCKGLLKGETGCLVMNTEKQASLSINNYTACLDELGVGNKYWVSKAGVYEILDPDEKKKFKTYKQEKVKLVIPFCYWSNLTQSVPQKINCKNILIDEFIKGEGERTSIISNKLLAWQKAFARLVRPVVGRKPITVMCANPNILEDDILSGLGIKWNWDKLANGEIEVYEDKPNGILAICCPKQFTINEMTETYQSINSWNPHKANEELYKFLPEEYRTVYPDLIINEPKQRLYYLGAMFLLGYNSYTNRYCVQSIAVNEHADLPTFCLYAIDILKKNYYYVKNKEDFEEHCREIVINQASANIIYDSCFTKEMIQLAMSVMYKNLLEKEN